MSTISIADLKTHLSAELKKVQAGEVITVTDHKKPVAEIHPVREKRSALTIRPATEKGPLGPWKRLYRGTDEELQQAILADREEHQW